MKRFVLPLSLPCLMVFPASALADDFTGFSMDFVEIGNPGNVDDIHGDGYGGVDYTYRMGVNEVSRAAINSYNANSGGPAITMADMTSFGGNGAAKPATGVSWNEAARFVNWLNTSQGHSAAYNTTGGANDDITLWTTGDAGYDPANPFRNSNAYYFLPSEDEWYKAAYYDSGANGGSGGYWNYATGSDSAPVSTNGGTAAGTAVYRDIVNPAPPGPADITNAGGLSPYGTMAQGGNVFEWIESGFNAPDDRADELRVVRGAAWFGGGFDGNIRATARGSGWPDEMTNSWGFRVASVPEPSGAMLTVLGMLGLVLRRRRV